MGAVFSRHHHCHHCCRHDIPGVKGKPDPNLYWGFFDGRAPVQTRGKWADPNYKLCDRSFIIVLVVGGVVVVVVGPNFKLCNR